ncbi:MAG: cyclic nucleotide-binding domain-containing protein [Magnetococcales bacterium]|nr:cyclic nucleotide-binding domain-containing protein [Magnetococcales bacterium]
MSQTDAMAPEKLLELLDKIPFFKDFSSYEKKRVVGNNTAFKSYRAGAKIIKEGDTDTSFFIILAGTASVVKQGATIINLGMGEFFGEMAFLTNEPRNTSVIAFDDAVVALQVDQELMKRLSADIREKVKDQIITKLIERLNKTTERLRVRM